MQIAIAQPTVPSADDVVVEQIAPRSTDPELRVLRALRVRLAVDPRDAALAAAVSRRWIERARRTGDPRDLGQAQAALTPWWTSADPPPDVLLMRATLKQSTHDFDGALSDVQRLIAQRPTDAQAWLTRATIELVRGQIAEAIRSCETLQPLAPPLVAQACLLEAQSVTGDARARYQQLADAVERERAHGGYVDSFEIVLAEMADRAGDATVALEHYRIAATRIGDTYSKGAYADALIDAGRPDDVIALLRDDTRNDALLLRLAIAQDQLKRDDATRSVAMLRDRFEAARLRGDTVHRREEARFVATLLHDAPRALDIARANFAVQREMWDQRVLLDTARATGSTADIERVRAFQRDSGFRDARLARWLADTPSVTQAAR